MEERLAAMEQALQELRTENRELRRELEELNERLAAHTAGQTEAVAATAAAANAVWPKGRWVYGALTLFVIVLPVVLLTLGHAGAFWSTVVGALNALFVAFIGPGAIRLLIEGLVRAVPGVLLGQTARITLDRFRKKRAR